MNYNEDKMAVDRLRLIVKLGQSSKKWIKFANRSKDRFFRFRELVNTQQDYAKDLQTIISGIQKPLRGCGAISEEDESLLFPNVASMIKLSEQLFGSLKDRLNKWDRRKTVIGE